MSSKRSQPEDRSPPQHRVRPPPGRSRTPDDGSPRPSGLGPSQAEPSGSVTQALESVASSVPSPQPSGELRPSGAVPSGGPSATDDPILHKLLTSKNTLKPTPNPTVEAQVLLGLSMVITTAVQQLRSDSVTEESDKHVRILHAFFAFMQTPAFQVYFHPTPFLATLEDDDLRTGLRNNPEFSTAISDLIYVVTNSVIARVHPALSLVLQYACSSPAAAAATPGAAPDSPDSKAVIDAWEAPLRGSAHFALLSALRDAHESNNEPKHMDQHYSNNVTVLQSSGTGKSRNVKEISKYVLVVPVVLRPADESGFPTADHDVRDYLVVPQGATVSVQHYQTKVRLFLRLMFLSVGYWLLHHPPPAVPTEYTHVAKHWMYLYRVTAWRLFLASKRAAIYREIIQAAERISATQSGDDADPSALKSTLQTFVRILKGADPDTTTAWDSSIVPAIFKAEMTPDQVDNVVLETNAVCKDAAIANPKASNVACPSFDANSTDLLVLLSFDEAQGLTRSTLRYALPGTVLGPAADEADPISSPLRTKSAYDVVLSVLNDLRAQVMGLFLSTSTKIGQFAPPAALSSSARQTKSARLQAPITELPFDCHLDDGIKLADLTDKGLSSISFMSKFGRPLFGSLLFKTEGLKTDVLHEREGDVLILVCAKLAGTSNYPSFAKTRAERPYAENAVVDVRLCIEYEPRKSSIFDSIVAELVAGHLRLAYSVPEHRLYFYSGYSSEPIIAEAAAMIMSFWMPPPGVQDPQERATYWNPLDTLIDMMKSNLIALGERGELVARLLLTLAYDRAMLLANPKERVGTRALPFSRGCGFPEFITALFGDKNAKVILGSKPDNLSSKVKLSEAFANARVRFTHFVRLGDDSGLTTTALCAAYIRGMAFICKVGQERVDLLVPVLINAEGPICPGNMTVLMIQVKRRKKPCKPKDTNYTAEALHVFDDSDAGDDLMPDADLKNRPYCTLLMELMAPMPRELRKEAARPSSSSSSSSGTSSPEPQNPGDGEPTAAASPDAGVHVLKGKKKASIRLTRGPPPPPPHPRYNLKAYGCSQSVYGGVIDADRHGGWGKAKYDQLLAKKTFFDEHPRKSLLSLVWRMKPQWVSNAVNNSYHWLKVKVQEEPEPSLDEAGHGVQPMSYKEK